MKRRQKKRKKKRRRMSKQSVIRKIVASKGRPEGSSLRLRWKQRLRLRRGLCRRSSAYRRVEFQYRREQFALPRCQRPQTQYRRQQC